MESNRREETVEEKGARLQVTLTDRESSCSILRERRTAKDLSEKIQKTVCGETRDVGRAAAERTDMETVFQNTRKLHEDR